MKTIRNKTRASIKKLPISSRRAAEEAIDSSKQDGKKTWHELLTKKELERKRI